MQSCQDFRIPLLLRTKPRTAYRSRYDSYDHGTFYRNRNLNRVMRIFKPVYFAVTLAQSIWSVKPLLHSLDQLERIVDEIRILC